MAAAEVTPTVSMAPGERSPFVSMAAVEQTPTGSQHFVSTAAAEPTPTLSIAEAEPEVHSLQPNRSHEDWHEGIFKCFERGVIRFLSTNCCACYTVGQVQNIIS